MSEVSAPVVAPVVAAPAADLKIPIPAEASQGSAGSAGKAADPTADVKPGESPAAAAARKFKIKVDGAEQEVDEDELVRGYQIRKASDKKFMEAAEATKAAAKLRSETNEALDVMLKDPQEFARRVKALGGDPYKLAEEMLTPLIEEQIRAEEEKTLTPEQKKHRDLELKVKEYEQKEAKREAAEKRAQEEKATSEKQAATQRASEEYGQVIIKALDQTKLPKTEETASRLLDLLELCVEQGVPVDARHLARDLEAQEAARANALRNPEMLDPEFRATIRREALNDPKLVEEIRKMAVAEYKQNNPLLGKSAPKTDNSERIVAKETREEKTARKKSNFNAVARELMLRKI